MRILKAAITGYGRFSDRTLVFAPGFNVIMGPNEQGKSTLRAFITDMLYGQKISRERRLYGESHELRLPWTSPENYGGRLIYELADEREFEVLRDFRQNAESVALFDALSGEDLTGDFPRLRNREVDFATVQLGLSREVFCASATVTHLTLDALGEAEALEQIREKIIALADSGVEGRTAENAVHLLRERIAQAGKADAKTRPLPAAHARIEALDRQIEQVRQRSRELTESAVMRAALLEDVAQLREHRAALEKQLIRAEAHERIARLREAENLSARIDTATQHCFALGAVREFPLDSAPDVRRAANRLETARLQIERTRAEGATLRRQLEAERKLAEDGGELDLEEIPAEDRARLVAAASVSAQGEERRAELLRRIENLESDVVEVQETLAQLPDFSRIAADPIELYTQLDKSFSIALRARDEDCAARDRLRKEVEACRERIGEPGELFWGRSHFGDIVREFEAGKRAREDQLEQRRSYIRSLENTRGELADGHGFLWPAIICVAAILVLLGVWYGSGLPKTLPAIFVVAIAAMYFTANFLHSRRVLRQYSRHIADSEAELAAFEQTHPDDTHDIAHLLERTGCETLRELEACYDEYRMAAAEYAAKVSMLEEQERRASESEARVPQLFERLCETFGQAGVPIESEADMEKAAGKVLVRYQEYRDAKRRLSECRAALDRVRDELRRLDAGREAADAEYEEAGNAVLHHLWQRGFSGLDAYPSAVDALRAYEAKVAEYQGRRARAALLQEKVAENVRQTALEENEIQQFRKELERLLDRAGAASLEQWQHLETQAIEYREVWGKRTALEEQLHTLLRGQSIEALRDAAAEDSVSGPAPATGREELARELAAMTRALEERTSEAHALHIAMAERAAAGPSLNELEEERACLMRRAALLECERDAAAHAIALIENIAGGRHARIAPVLAAQASAYLAEITGGVYSEVEVSRGLRVSVRIPQTGRMDNAPEKTLSQGAVDQIYFALRLALVKSLSQSGEPIPMLLDDPFANYDDERLEHTMRLVKRLSESNQILLFTCREDVVRAAEAAGAPVTRL